MVVSIITVVFNNKKYIEDCLVSVQSQTYKAIEHIVIDGGSTDGTLEILEKHKSKIFKLIIERDAGMYDALNKGFKLASGQIIGLLHSDDVFNNNSVIESIANEFSKGNIDGLYGNLIYVSQTNPQKIQRYWESKEFNPKMIAQGWMPPHPTLFLQKKVIEKTGYFDLNFKIAADYDYMLRVLQTQGIRLKYLPIVITKMRTGGKSNKSLRNIFLKSWDDYCILKKNKAGGMVTLIRKNTSKIGQFLHQSKNHNNGL